MEKKGFTLIELLSVIVILAIIALIAIPVIQSVVETAEKGSFKSSGYGIVDAATYDCSTSVLNNKNITEKYTINNGTFSDSILKIKGKIPDDGTISVNSKCEVSLVMHSGKWCAKKSFEEDEIKISDYVDGTCGETGSSPLADKLKNLTVGIQKGVNLGDNEYDAKLVNYASNIDYYNSYYFTGLNPNNYIKIGNNVYRIIGIDSQGISVVGTSFTFDDSNYDTYGILTNATMINANSNPDNNAFYKNGVTYSTYNTGVFVNDYLTYFDYDVTLDRQEFSTCIFEKNLEDYQERSYYSNAFADCSKPTWLSNMSESIDIKMKIFADGGTSQQKSVYLYNGKIVQGSDSYDIEENACENCISYKKFYLKNDIQYVSGDGSSANPYTYKTNIPTVSYKISDTALNSIKESATSYFYNLSSLATGNACVSLETLVSEGYLTSPLIDSVNKGIISTNRVINAEIDSNLEPVNLTLGAVGTTCP